MNYLQITEAAIAYSDRTDAEVIDRIDTFILMTESRINRALQVQQMAIRTCLTILTDQEYFGLPEGFSSLRDIEIVDGTGNRITLPMYTPEQLNKHHLSGSTSPAYSIVADQLHIVPVLEGCQLEIIYHKDITHLDNTNPTNWLTEKHPDIYVHGILVEINAFIKSPEGAALWDSRFKSAIGEIVSDDFISRWSGTPLEIRLT